MKTNLKNKKTENKIQEKNKTNKSKLSTWKLLAIGFIIIFLVVVGFALFRLHKFESSFHKATLNETNSAKLAVFDYLTSTGRSVNTENIIVSQKIKNIELHSPKKNRFENNNDDNETAEDLEKDKKENDDKQVLEAYIIENNTRDTFLIDIDTKQIVMHTQMEVFGWMNESNFHNSRMSQQGRINNWK